MTQEEIDKLPSPLFIPARDMMLCQREERSRTGLFLPDESVDKIQVCRVLVRGPGLVLDSGAVKQCPYRRGSRIFISPQDGYPITLDGVKFWLVEVAEVMGELLSDETTAFGRDIC